MNTVKLFSSLLTLLITSLNPLMSQQGTLEHWIPDNIGDQYQVSECEDYELLDDENVTNHFKVEYLFQEETLAEVLAIQTIKQCYKGSYNYSFRSDQTKLVNHDIIVIDDFKLLVSEYRDPLNNVFYTCQFSMLETGHLSYQFFNPWIDSEYVSQYRILNFYVMSIDKQIVKLLTDEIVTKFAKQTEVFQSSTLSLQPSLFVNQAKYSMGSLNLQIENNALEDRNIKVNVMSKQSEFGIQEEFQFDLIIQNGLRAYEITDVKLFNASIEIIENGNLIDRLFIKDGEWTIDNPNDAYLFNVRSEVRKESSESFKIEREVIAVARFYNEITIRKELLPNAYPVDLSSFNGFSFSQVGIDEIGIELFENEKLIQKIHFKSEEGLNSIGMDLNDCYQVTHLKINLKSYNLANPMLISEMEFHDEMLISATEEIDELMLTVFPNPSIDQLSIRLGNPDLIGHEYKVVNTAAQKMASGNFDRETSIIDVSNFNSGSYYLVYRNQENIESHIMFLKL